METYVALFKLTDQGVMTHGPKRLDRERVHVDGITYINFFATPNSRYDGIGVFESEDAATAHRAIYRLRQPGDLDVEVMPAYDADATVTLMTPLLVD